MTESWSVNYYNESLSFFWIKKRSPIMEKLFWKTFKKNIFV